MIQSRILCRSLTIWPISVTCGCRVICHGRGCPIASAKAVLEPSALKRPESAAIRPALAVLNILVLVMAIARSETRPQRPPPGSNGSYLGVKPQTAQRRNAAAAGLLTHLRPQPAR